jgi:hypothetical protein
VLSGREQARGGLGEAIGAEVLAARVASGVAGDFGHPGVEVGAGLEGCKLAHGDHGGVLQDIVGFGAIARDACGDEPHLRACGFEEREEVCVRARRHAAGDAGRVRCA